jgi:hypothetical protein
MTSALADHSTDPINKPILDKRLPHDGNTCFRNSLQSGADIPVGGYGAPPGGGVHRSQSGSVSGPPMGRVTDGTRIMDGLNVCYTPYYGGYYGYW